MMEPEIAYNYRSSCENPLRQHRGPAQMCCKAETYIVAVQLHANQRQG
jgi:hypothetical protein